MPIIKSLFELTATPILFIVILILKIVEHYTDKSKLRNLDERILIIKP